MHFCKGLRLVHQPVQHHMADAIRVAYVLQGVVLQDHQVCQFAGLQ
jgi:hypothetical protein